MARNDQVKTYVIEYPFGGETCCERIRASSWVEAEARLKALGWGRVEGIVDEQASLPGWLPEWTIRLILAWRNRTWWRS